MHSIGLRNAAGGSLAADVRTLLHYRWLIRFLVSQTRKAELLGTVLGYAWFLLEPALNIAVYYFVVVIVFGRNSGSAQQSFVHITLGIAHFLLLQHVVQTCTGALLLNEGLLMQVKIEPLVFTAAAFSKALKDSIPAIVLAALIYLALGPGVSWRLLVYPLCLASLVVLAWSLALLLSTLYVFFRDLEHIVAIAMRVLMYTTPVIYSVALVPQRFQGIYLSNPFACLFALLPWCMLGGDPPPAAAVAGLVTFLAAVLVGAHVVYDRLKVRFTKAF